ncbi:hypothetical protein Hdeb2414_s0022g00613021 [Helianthus debilis subsp. tardiflorus]
MVYKSYKAHQPLNLILGGQIFVQNLNARSFALPHRLFISHFILCFLYDLGFLTHPVFLSLSLSTNPFQNSNPLKQTDFNFHHPEEISGAIQRRTLSVQSHRCKHILFINNFRHRLSYLYYLTKVKEERLNVLEKA